MEENDDVNITVKRAIVNPLGVTQIKEAAQKILCRKIEIDEEYYDDMVEVFGEIHNDEPCKLEKVLSKLGYQIDIRDVDMEFYHYEECIRDVEHIGDVYLRGKMVIGFSFPIMGCEYLTDKRSSSTGTFTPYGVCGQGVIANTLVGIRPAYRERTAIIFNVIFLDEVRSYFWDDNDIVEIKRSEVSYFEFSGPRNLISVSPIIECDKELVVNDMKFNISPVVWYDPTIDVMSAMPRKCDGVIVDINGCNYYSPRERRVVLTCFGDECVDKNGITYDYDCSNAGNCLFVMTDEEMKFVSSTNQSSSSTQFIDVMRRNVVVMEDLDKFFFFPRIGLRTQSVIPFVPGEKPPLIRWKRGDPVLWFPSNDRNGVSRNAIVSRYMQQRNEYNRFEIDMHLAAHPVIYNGNNTLPSELIKDRTYFWKYKNETYCSFKCDESFLGKWFARSQRDFTKRSNVIRDTRYLLYVLKKL